MLGDQFEQRDHRVIGGLKIDHKILSNWLGLNVVNDLGIEVRDDDVFYIALNHTHDRNVYEKLSQDSLNLFSFSPYFANRIQWTNRFRTVAGVRGDLFDGRVTDRLGGPNGGVATAFLASPKLQLVFGPWWDTEMYIDGGFGFHERH